MSSFQPHLLHQKYAASPGFHLGISSFPGPWRMDFRFVTSWTWKIKCGVSVPLAERIHTPFMQFSESVRAVLRSYWRALKWWGFKKTKTGLNYVFDSPLHPENFFLWLSITLSWKRTSASATFGPWALAVEKRGGSAKNHLALRSERQV